MRRRAVLLAALVLPVTSAVAILAYPRRAPLGPEIIADRIVVRKSDRRMTLFSDGRPIRTYEIALGFGEPGAKAREGDGRTPEGLYSISGRNPQSAYHLSLRISYPEARDIAAAEALGASPGGDIMIHGTRNGLGLFGAFARTVDWTAGCIAVTNEEIEEIWRAVPDGTPIEILP